MAGLPSRQSEPHMSSQEHVRLALDIAQQRAPFDATGELHRHEMRRLARAQVHATLAVREALPVRRLQAGADVLAVQCQRFLEFGLVHGGLVVRSIHPL